MNLAVPLARSASSAGTQQCSRIPHLQYHIIRNQIRTQRSIKNGISKFQQSVRSQSTLTADDVLPQKSRDGSHTSWTGFKSFQRSGTQANIAQNELETIPDTQSEELQSSNPTRADSAQNENPTVHGIFHDTNADRILLTLTTTKTGDEFIRTASNDDFDRAFCALDTGSLIEPFVQLQWFNRATNYDYGKLPMNRSLLSKLQDVEKKIELMVEKRLESGHSLTIHVCRHYLKFAANVGRALTARHVLDELMPRFGLVPDLACYNYYMQALNWNLMFGEDARFNLRVTKHTQELRNKQKPESYLKGYKILGDNNSVRSNALKVFQQLATTRLSADESTFTNLMVAMAREGDMAGIESVLKSVWHIDPPMLGTFDEEEIESPTFYEEGHHLRPTEKLLYAVMHCYCINNQVGKAWMLLDYISRNYNLSVPHKVWSHLFEWAYVLSVRRSPSQDRHGLRLGQLPLDEFENLYAVLTDEPYKIEPDHLILNYRARIWVHRRHADHAIESLGQAKALLHKDVISLMEIMESIQRLCMNSSLSAIGSSFFDLRSKFLRKYLEVYSQLDMMRRTTHQVLGEDDFNGSGKQRSWATQRLPKLVEQFSLHVNDVLNYNIGTGKVALWLRPHRQAALWNEWPNFIQRAATIWAALNADDIEVLTSNWANLAQRLEQIEVKCALSRCQGKPPSHAPENCPRMEIPMYSFSGPESRGSLLNVNTPRFKRMLRKSERRKAGDIHMPLDKRVSKSRRPDRNFSAKSPKSADGQALPGLGGSLALDSCNVTVKSLE